ncbi:hypothetical protein IWQ56_000523 [Coemansia nantahalensis]|nr:hypothetical protein IWQ56_000523 [Coemansia nantahalensis]
MGDAEMLVAGARFAGIVLSAMSAVASLVVIASYLRMAARFRSHIRQLTDGHKPPPPLVVGAHRGDGDLSHESFVVTPRTAQHWQPQPPNYCGGCSSRAAESLPGTAAAPRRPSALSGGAASAAAGRSSHLARVSQSTPTTADSASSWSLTSICKRQGQRRPQRPFHGIPLAGPDADCRRAGCGISPERLVGLVGPPRRIARPPSSKTAVVAVIDLLVHVAWIVSTTATESSGVCAAPVFFLQWAQLAYMFYLASSALASLARLRNMRGGGAGHKSGHRHAATVGAAGAAAALLSLLPALLGSAQYDAGLQTCWMAGGSSVALRWVWMTLNSWVVLSLVVLAATSVYIGLILSNERRSILCTAAGALSAPAGPHMADVAARARAGVPHPLYIPPAGVGVSLPTGTSSRHCRASGPYSAGHHVPTPVPSAGSGKATFRSSQALHGGRGARESLGLMPKSACSYVRLGDGVQQPAFAVARNPIALAHMALHGQRPTAQTAGGQRRGPSRVASHSTMYTAPAHRSISSAGELACSCRHHSAWAARTPSISSHGSGRSMTPPLPPPATDGSHGPHGARWGQPQPATGHASSPLRPASARGSRGAPSGCQSLYPASLHGYPWPTTRHMSMPVPASRSTCAAAARERAAAAAAAPPLPVPPRHIRQHSTPPDAHRAPETPGWASDGPQTQPPGAVANAMPPAKDEHTASAKQTGGSSTRDASARHMRRIERRVHMLISTGAMRMAARSVVPFATQLAMVVWSTVYAANRGASSHPALYAAAILLLSTQGLLDMMLYYIFEMQPDESVASLPGFSSTTLSGASAGASARDNWSGSRPTNQWASAAHLPRDARRDSGRSYAAHRALPPYYCCGCPGCQRPSQDQSCYRRTSSRLHHQPQPLLLAGKPGAPRRSSTGGNGDPWPLFALEPLIFRRADRSSNAMQSDTLHGSDCAAWSHMDALSLCDSACASRFSTPAAPPQPRLPVLNGWGEGDSEDASPRPSPARL